jgi:drug/metabolite transporter (DMT)-like permease
MLLYFKLIQDTSAVFASTSSYLLPIVSVIWGVIDGEEFTFWHVFGSALILIGIYLIREKKKDLKLAPDLANQSPSESKEK